MGYSVIHIFGPSGGGTTTLGAAVAAQGGLVHIDSDDYFHLPSDPPFTRQRPAEERDAMLREAIAKARGCVVSGSVMGWAEDLQGLMTLAVFLYTPTELRLPRLREREQKKYGVRVLPGGDMYEDHEWFINWAGTYETGGLEGEGRTLAKHERWLEGFACPVLRMDGSAPPQENAARVLAEAGIIEN